MNFNYHTHTEKCGHATGDPESYIRRAIQCGITHMGFSDHAPFLSSNGHESSFRVPFAEAKAYFQELNALRQQYKGVIDIKICCEMEYYAEHFEKMLKTVQDLGAEYLILGQHYLAPETPDMPHTIEETKCEKRLTEYVDAIVGAMQSGMFTYVAHPDILNFTGDPEVYECQMRKICITARETDIPLEINCLGIRDNRRYPNDAFWKIVGEEGSPVTIGFDAHDIMSAYDFQSIKKAKELIKKYGLGYIGRPKLRLLTDNICKY